MAHSSPSSLRLTLRVVYSLEDIRNLLSERGFTPGGFCAPTGQGLYDESSEWEYDEHEHGYGLRSLYDPGSGCLLQICGSPLMLIQITNYTPEFPSKMTCGASSFYVNFLVDDKSLWTLGFSVTKQGIENFCKMFIPVSLEDFLSESGGLLGPSTPR